MQSSAPQPRYLFTQETSLDEVFDIIAKHYLRTPYPKQLPIHPRIARIYHGVLHAVSCVENLDLIIALMREFIPGSSLLPQIETLLANVQSRKLLLIAIYCHDIGNEQEADPDNSKSARLFEMILARTNYPLERVQIFANAIANKDAANAGIIGLLIHEVDWLDYGRVLQKKELFDVTKSYLYGYIDKNKYPEKSVREQFTSLCNFIHFRHRTIYGTPDHISIENSNRPYTEFKRFATRFASEFPVPQFDENGNFTGYYVSPPASEVKQDINPLVTHKIENLEQQLRQTLQPLNEQKFTLPKQGFIRRLGVMPSNPAKSIFDPQKLMKEFGFILSNNIPGKTVIMRPASYFHEGLPIKSYVENLDLPGVIISTETICDIHYKRNVGSNNLQSGNFNMERPDAKRIPQLPKFQAKLLEQEARRTGKIIDNHNHYYGLDSLPQTESLLNYRPDEIIGILHSKAYAKYSVFLWFQALAITKKTLPFFSYDFKTGLRFIPAAEVIADFFNPEPKPASPPARPLPKQLLMLTCSLEQHPADEKHPISYSFLVNRTHLTGAAPTANEDGFATPEFIDCKAYVAANGRPILEYTLDEKLHQEECADLALLQKFYQQQLITKINKLLFDPAIKAALLKLGFIDVHLSLKLDKRKNKYSVHCTFRQTETKNIQLLLNFIGYSFSYRILQPEQQEVCDTVILSAPQALPTIDAKLRSQNKILASYQPGNVSQPLSVAANFIEEINDYIDKGYCELPSPDILYKSLRAALAQETSPIEKLQFFLRDILSKIINEDRQFDVEGCDLIDYICNAFLLFYLNFFNIQSIPKIEADYLIKVMKLILGYFDDEDEDYLDDPSLERMHKQWSADNYCDYFPLIQWDGDITAEDLIKENTMDGFALAFNNLLNLPRDLLIEHKIIYVISSDDGDKLLAADPQKCLFRYDFAFSMPCLHSTHGSTLIEISFAATSQLLIAEAHLIARTYKYTFTQLLTDFAFSPMPESTEKLQPGIKFFETRSAQAQLTQTYFIKKIMKNYCKKSLPKIYFLNESLRTALAENTSPTEKLLIFLRAILLNILTEYNKPPVTDGKNLIDYLGNAILLFYLKFFNLTFIHANEAAHLTQVIRLILGYFTAEEAQDNPSLRNIYTTWFTEKGDLFPLIQQGGMVNTFDLIQENTLNGLALAFKNLLNLPRDLLIEPNKIIYIISGSERDRLLNQHPEKCLFRYNFRLLGLCLDSGRDIFPINLTLVGSLSDHLLTAANSRGYTHFLKDFAFQPMPRLAPPSRLLQNNLFQSPAAMPPRFNRHSDEEKKLQP